MVDTTIKMPLLSPVRIPTKGLPWYKRFLKSFKARDWLLEEDYTLYIPWLNETLLIPKGFIFDAASVPRMLWPICDPTGILLLGSMFHDFGYRYNCFLTTKFKVVHQFAGQEFFDKQLKDMCTYVNGCYIMETVAWATLRIFGWFGWYNSRKANRNVFIDYSDRNVSAV